MKIILITVIYSHINNGTMTDRGMIGRESELTFLENLWNQKGLVTCCVWGRRRIGKSTILNEFGRGKRTLYLQGIEGSYYENLYSISQDISEFLGEDIPTAPNLSHVMKLIENICREDRTLVIIDELPYLLKSAPQASSVIQKSLDRGLKELDCMFVVCGSSISVMREETQNARKPLYGRFENTLQVRPLSIEECKAFHPNFDDETSLRWYCTVGGIPYYHLNIDGKSYEQLVKEKFLTEDGPWKDDAASVILQEFNGNTHYTGAVKCIADGSVRQSEIADKMGIDRPACKKILDNLEFIGMIERRIPMGGSPRKPVYSIRDPFISFHYNVIAKNARLIGRKSSTTALYNVLKNDIDTQIGHAFEKVCGDWLDSAYMVAERGQWWGKIDGTDADIDIVAKVYDDRRMIHTVLAECKFSRKRMGFSAYNTLVSRSKAAGFTENVSFMLFSAIGFDDELREYASDEGIALVDGETLMGKREPPVLFDMSG